MRAIVVSLLVAAAALSCNRVRDLAAPRKPSIILISIDTLRSDHLPMYGYGGVETPNLDAFRSDSILFRRAYSHCPLTLPSHATILTGRLPSGNGVRDNLGYQLDKKIPTLPELLTRQGYATGAAVSAIVLRGETGISRGFSFYDDDIDVDTRFLSLGRAQRNGDETRQVAEKWIGAHDQSPFFFFLHIYEPHTPYEPPEPFRSRYASHPYDGEIATADAIVGRFIDFLKARHLYDSAMIVILSDHGEGLGDHGEDEHGILLYREAIQVPLLVKLPASRSRGTSVESPVQLVDILPTLAEEAHVPQALLGPGDGTSLLASKIAPRPIYSETYYPRFHFGWSDLHSLVSDTDHYIQAPKPELYDLAADPAEKSNRLLESRRAYNSMRTAIQPFIKDTSAPGPVDPEQARKLAALGYIGSTASTAAGEELPDPKDHINSAGRIKEGFLAVQEQRYAAAIPIFQELLAENPKMLDIWSAEARALAKLGRVREAEQAAKQALRLSPGASNLALMVANFSLDLHDLDSAEKHAELALSDDPAQAHYLLAQVWLARKDYGRATQEVNAIVAGHRDRPLALMLLGQIAMEQKKFTEALAQFDAAMTILKTRSHSPIPNLNFLRGDTLARMGRSEEAEEALRTEIRDFPADPRAYENLILLYVAEGKTQEATALVFALEKASPTPPSYAAISETLRTVGDLNGAHFWAARGLKQFPDDQRLRTLSRT